MPFTARDMLHANHAHPPHDRADGPASLCGGIQFILGNPHTTFQGISIDTRTIRKGDLFFAIAGPHHDGHDHLEEAVRKGAAGFVIEALDPRLRFDHEEAPVIFQVPSSVAAMQQWARHLRKQSKATVFGITGTNGKTTTKEMLSAILGRIAKTLATRGNLNNH